MQNAARRNCIVWSVALYLAICFVATYALFMYVVAAPRSAWAIQIGFFFQPRRDRHADRACCRSTSWAAFRRKVVLNCVACRRVDAGSVSSPG